MLITCLHIFSRYLNGADTGSTSGKNVRDEMLDLVRLPSLNSRQAPAPHLRTYINPAVSEETTSV